ncbi:MAG: hypothetical protein QF405_05310 [Roseibacillus sp.]|jgi:hypothetical protein|nr:hypothetical protein [Roseibacillus sp.]MCP4729454.1 LamG domain-containing protein [Roseibacillus sp.]MDP7107248.1 hypothetical protein [Roseibacillus sp.]MDP7307041.1 hypothetical protein [Roseibacillus sp.]HJM62527.1 hypothetical protein [Roseibacillus sp.]|tara:strand:+ start:1712 stop:2578 length:867 start_codon:yes stop_codon:yes gene_type:complete
MTFPLTALLPACLLGLAAVSAAGDTAPLPLVTGLLLDLDADRDVTRENGNHVSKWVNQAPGAPAGALDFVKRDQGRKIAGSGRPVLKEKVKALKGHSALVFRQGELVNMDEDAFDGLTTGRGFTWFCVLSVYPQRVGVKDVNSFFGNLRNGHKYEGLWANLKDDNTLWTGGRNGITFGRFDQNNPLIPGLKLETGRYYLVASRMAAGTGRQTIELFVNTPRAVGSGPFPVNPGANPSRLAVGQERDAIQHPGHESFDGEIARLLIYEGALGEEQLATMFAFLKESYGL